MPPLGIKDPSRMETTRFHTATDPLFWSIDNRPLGDIEQRTKDLDRIFTPARGFRPRQTIASSGNIQVEAGVYVSGGTTINQVALSTTAIPAAGAGNIRIDLLWFNLTTGAIVRTAGVEILLGGGFAACVKPSLPASAGGVPIAYVYVDAGPTAFDESIAVNTAGCIVDIRPGIGFHPGYLFEIANANILSDLVSGSAGSSAKIVRADHRHNLNVDATNPAQLSASAAATPGVADIYPRRDHIHDLLIETVPGNLKVDVAAGAVGALATLPRADHQHPLNVDATAPAQIVAGAGSPGVASTYARRDHIHQDAASAGMQSTFDFDWVASAAAVNTGALGFTPRFAYAIFAGRDSALTNALHCISTGFATAGPFARSVAQLDHLNNDNVDTSWDSTTSIAGVAPVNTGAPGLVYAHSIALRVTAFGAANIQITPSANITGKLSILVVG